MYLKKVEGARTVALPGGRVMSRADLPDPRTRRWVASRKAAVVAGVESGLVSREWAIATYALSEEEFDSWIRAVASRRREWLADYRPETVSTALSCMSQEYSSVTSD